MHQNRNRLCLDIYRCAGIKCLWKLQTKTPSAPREKKPGMQKLKQRNGVNASWYSWFYCDPCQTDKNTSSSLKVISAVYPCTLHFHGTPKSGRFTESRDAQIRLPIRGLCISVDSQLGDKLRNHLQFLLPYSLNWALFIKPGQIGTK